MAAQLELLFDKPRCRATDPISSRLAGEQLEAAGVLSRQRAEVLDALKRFPNSTNAELASRAGLDRYMVARRISELERLKLVVRGAVRASEVGRAAESWSAK